MFFVDRYLCVDFVVELVSKNEKRTLIYEVLMNLKRWVVVVFIRLG
jgi:Uma2 family endonuclease